MALLAVWLAACSALPFGRPAAATPQPTAAPERSATPRPTQPNPFASPTPSPTPVVDLADLRGAQVVLWHPFSGKMADLFDELADEFSDDNEWGISASAVSMQSDSAMSAAMSTAMTGAMEQAAPEAQPDAVLALTPLLNGWYESGWLARLDDFIAAPELGLSEDALAQFDPAFWQQDRSGEAQVGVPLLRTAYGLIYNQTWAQELGFSTPPLTPAQFQEQACAAAKENNRSQYLEKRGTGGWLVDATSITALSWLTTFGAQVTPFQAGDAYRFNQPEAEAAFTFLRGMQEAGCLWVSRNPTAPQYFADRYALFYSASLQALNGQQIVMTNLESSDAWTFIPYPSTKSAPFVLSDGYSLGLVQASPQEAYAAWLFLRWLAGSENLARLAAAYPGLPVTGDASSSAAASFPQRLIRPLQAVAQPAPGLSSWLTARRPLEDAFWQLFNLATAEQLPEVLPQLDALVQDLLRQP